MRVGKIAHASVVVEAGDICCFMDPVLVDPFESGANTFDPPVEIDRDAVRARCNLVVISHGHMDHFSPRSLAVFDRAIPVLYPENDALIERALDRLGFANRTPITAGTKIESSGTSSTRWSTSASSPRFVS
jgi:L-ascorbate metabolism protein UlaG (beta-lactamase superfamily)